MKFNHLKRYLFVLAVAIIFVSCCSLTASADVWDGEGLPVGGNASAVKGDFNLPTTTTDNIVGYRFTVYDTDGAKNGNSVDLYFSGGTKYYQTASSNKKGHTEYYAEYKAGKAPKLGSIKYLAPDADYVLASLPKVPSKMEDWLNEESANMISRACGADGFSTATSYIIVEPLYRAKLNGAGPYSMTLAEENLSDYVKLAEIGEKLEVLQAELETAYTEWEELA